MTKWYAFAGAVLGAVSWVSVAVANEEATAAATTETAQVEMAAEEATTDAAQVEMAAEEATAAAAEETAATEMAAEEASVAHEQAALVAHGEAADHAAPTTPAEGWNVLWYHVLLDLYVIGIVFGAVTLGFMFAYIRKREDQEGDLPAMTLAVSLAWALVPSFIFMADDFYLAANGWKLWIEQRNVPEGAMEIKGLAYMYDWEFEFDNGYVATGNESRENPILLPIGAPISIRSHSEDVVHSLGFPDMRIKEDVMPGRTTFIWFQGTKPGTHTFTCFEYCGVGHSNMWGRVKMVPMAEFEAWIAEQA